MTTRVIHEGEHKNSVRCEATKLGKFHYSVEMWQRSRFGAPYVKVHAGSISAAYKACEAAINAK